MIVHMYLYKCILASYDTVILFLKKFHSSDVSSSEGAMVPRKVVSYLKARFPPLPACSLCTHYKYYSNEL